jgi:hypothetical protein
MDIIKSLILVLAAVGLLIGSQQGGDIQEDRASSVAQVDQFYEDLNFIGSLTTKDERTRLAGYLTRPHTEPVLKNDRQRQVFRRMQRVRDCVLVVDPEMVKNPVKEAWTPLRNLFRTDLVVIKKLRRTTEGAAVDVVSYDLSPEPVLRFIREFEEAPENWAFPSAEELLARLGRGMVRSQEVHLWKKRGGRWMKLDSHFTFLDLKR